MAADIRGHDNDGIFEIYRSAVAISQATVIENLEQDVEDVGMRLLDFVEQNDRVRSSSHRLGELPAFIVPDIARRGADQTRDRVPLLILGHVDAHHIVLIVEQKLSQSARQFGLTNAGWSEENK